MKFPGHPVFSGHTIYPHGIHTLPVPTGSPHWSARTCWMVSFGGSWISTTLSDVLRVTLCGASLATFKPRDGEQPFNDAFKTGQIIIFHQPRFPWNKGNSLTKPQFWGEVVWGRYNLTRFMYTLTAPKELLLIPKPTQLVFHCNTWATKKTLLLSWLFNRDLLILIMVYEIIPTWLGSISPPYTA